MQPIAFYFDLKYAYTMMRTRSKIGKIPAMCVDFKLIQHSLSCHPKLSNNKLMLDSYIVIIGPSKQLFLTTSQYLNKKICKQANNSSNLDSTMTKICVCDF